MVKPKNMVHRKDGRISVHDHMTVNLVKELIKKDILVIAVGCGCHGLEVAGLANTDAIVLLINY